MANSIQHSWDPDFSANSPLFKPIAALAEKLINHHSNNWPDLGDYQHLLNTHAGDICSQNGAAIRFVTQGQRPACFDQHYEPRIYLKGEVQTRTQNWHDFFQVLVWSLFPRIKAQLNALHYQAAAKRLSSIPRQHNRSPIENAITLFDECGIIVISSDPTLLDLIRNFQWQQLFWRHRDELEQKLQCIVFGHALYEKALQPYIGMTGNALLIDVDEAFHSLSPQQQSTQLDKQISHFMSRNATEFNPAVLTPFPLLGMPGWDKANHDEKYYDNKSYFRSKHQRRPASL